MGCEHSGVFQGVLCSLSSGPLPSALRSCFTGAPTYQVSSPSPQSQEDLAPERKSSDAFTDGRGTQEQRRRPPRPPQRGSETGPGWASAGPQNTLLLAVTFISRLEKALASYPLWISDFPTVVPAFSQQQPPPPSPTPTAAGSQWYSRVNQKLLYFALESRPSFLCPSAIGSARSLAYIALEE